MHGLTLRAISGSAAVACARYGHASKPFSKRRGAVFRLIGKDGLPDGWNVSFAEYDGGVISCAARFVPQIVLKEHVFHVG